MQRLSILIIALLVGAAAPAKAWCEASCLAPAPSESATPHCPSHEPPADGPSLTAAGDADCPAIDSARPVPSKLQLNLAIAAAMPLPGATAPSHPCVAAPPHPRTSSLFERCSPLRI